MNALIEGGKLVPVIDRTYVLSELPEAVGFFGEGLQRGKIGISVSLEQAF